MPRLLASFAGIRRTWLRGDLVAALTVWAVLIPESLAEAAATTRSQHGRPGTRKAGDNSARW